MAVVQTTIWPVVVRRSYAVHILNPPLPPIGTIASWPPQVASAFPAQCNPNRVSLSNCEQVADDGVGGEAQKAALCSHIPKTQKLVLPIFKSGKVRNLIYFCSSVAILPINFQIWRKLETGSVNEDMKVFLFLPPYIFTFFMMSFWSYSSFNSFPKNF